MPKITDQPLISETYGYMEKRVSVMSKKLREAKKENTVLTKARDKYLQRFTVAHEKVLAGEVTIEILTDAIRHMLVDTEDPDTVYTVTMKSINNAKRVIGVIK